MKYLRQYIRLLVESEEKELTPEEEVANIMQLWDADQWEQAQDLAYMMGPEISRHPDLQIWQLMNGENGDILIDGLNYDQAMDPKYHAFLADAHEAIDDEPDSPYYGRKVSGASARTHPPTQEDFDGRMSYLEEEGLKIEVLEVDEESFTVALEIPPA